MSDKRYSAVRSLFRYFEFIRMNSPDCLIELEKKILDKRFKTLSAEDISHIILEWPKYLKKQMVDAEIQDEQVMSQVRLEMGRLN